MLSDIQKQNGINVLSLCDGISCALLALQKAGVKIKNYIRADVCPKANYVSYKNHPGLINLGDVTQINISHSPAGTIIQSNDGTTILKDGIDLIVFGSECQSFSLQGGQLGFTSLSGQIMLECIRLWKESGADYFLCENVRMKPIFKDAISERFNTQPVILNALDFGAIQSRNRLYWTNIPILDKSEFMELKNISDIIIGEGHPMTCRKGKNGMPRTIHRTAHFGCLTKSYFKGIRADGRPAIGTVESGYFDDHYPNDIRSLTPIEFERAQSLPQKKINLILKICLDQAKNYVNAVEKNHKLLKLALSVENEQLKDFVNHVELNTKQNNHKIKYTVHQNADMPIQKHSKSVTPENLKELNTTANNAESFAKSQNQNQEEDSVVSNAFINIIEGKIIPYGKAELHQKDNIFHKQLNGKMPLVLYGKEIMELVENVDAGTIKIKDTNFISTTLSALNINNLELMLAIYYLYVKNVITGYTLDITPQKNLSLSYVINEGYTEGISKTARYQVIGNAWYVDKVAHIFKGLL